MSTFGTYADGAFQLKQEGETIVLSFKPGLPATGQGTVSWNIPVPGGNCNDAASKDGAYCGIVVLLSPTPLTPNHIPKNGLVYVADPTANPDMHAGDRISGALVVGAFYEGEKKSRGETLTTSFVVSDLRPDTAYYVGAYAVDCQLRYHSDGVRAYSDKYAREFSPSQPSTQTIKIGDGVLPTDGTGLDPTVTYQFDTIWDDSYPDRNNEKVFRISVDGSKAGTYDDLVREINKQFAMLENPLQSPVPPNTGKLYWNATDKTLYEFDGTENVAVSNVLREPTDPAAVAPGSYWYKPSTKELFVSSVSPMSWTPVDVIDYGPVDPRDFKCTDHWFNGTQAYVWNGSAWCEVPTVVAEIDPSSATMVCGAYWYHTDPTNPAMFKWNTETCDWDPVGAIVWPVAPNTLADGTYWFDLDTDKLFQYSASPAGWAEQTAAIVSTTQPITTLAGSLWFNPTTENLYEYSGTEWVQILVLVWAGDPTDVTSCDLWWRSTDDELFVWDTVNLSWNPVVSLTQSATDPRLPPTLPTGMIWHDPSTGVIFRWDGAAWQNVNVVVNPTDPTAHTPGDAWFNEATGEWYIWEIPSIGFWNLVDPIDSENDPTMFPNGTYWFNTTAGQLYTRNGMAWISTPFVTSSPKHKKGDIWFDNSTDTLYEWSGYEWKQTQPLIYVNGTTDGNLLFTTRDVGGSMNFMVLTPGTPGELGTGFAEFGYQELPGSIYRNSQPDFFVSDIPEDEFLFTNLAGETRLLTHTYGADGVSSVPSYMEMGVGTDGSPDERRELANSIRTQLGHPIVTVELENHHIDTAIRLALEVFRQRSSAAYTRGFFFLDIIPGQQEYVMSNKNQGYNKIINIASARRFTSAFLSTAHGAGVYGQIVLQHLYNMGTYDLTSFHLISQYVEQMEHLFATRLTFQWNESNRKLNFYTSFVRQERVMLDCTVERTEQELMTDRMSKNWIRRWALAEAMLMLAHIRGKFGSLPGAGGGITLNASELISQAAELKQQLIEEIDDYVAADPEDLGLHTTFIIG